MIAPYSSTDLAKSRGDSKEVDIVDRLEGAILEGHGAVDLPPVNYFSPGIYMREVTMYAGEIIIGHLHKTNHFNIVMSGLAEVIMNGESYMIRGGDVFESGTNVRKSLHIIEDMRWITVHPNKDNCESVEELEDRLVEKSEAYESYMKMMKTQFIEGGSKCLSE